MNIFIAFTLVLATLPSSAALEYSPEDVINPRLYPSKVLTDETAQEMQKYFNVYFLPPMWVFDCEGYLNVQTFILLHERIEEFYNETKAELGVALINKISPEYNSETFANEVFNNWGFESKKSSKALLLLLYVEDRQLGIHIGNGSKERFNFDELEEIKVKIDSHLQLGDINKAVEIGVSELITQYKNYQGSFGDVMIIISLIFGPFIVFVPIVFCCCDCYKRWENRQKNQQKKEIDGLQQYLQDPQSSHFPYYSTACPICQERFSRKHTKRMEIYAS
ncbi:MAG: hypothetical protein EZS28_023997 [Streblomastix strix]|uniref:TPM domain-containing protein n=1 Tax=Streblomastix strix TaxID=222440 RepID=A0A5J4VD44_9EUKA|nr:MAG: hypothetical protein EZS28_023997 [Streblomastix strix]